MIGKFGKLPAKVDGRTLRLENYLVPGALPRVPAAVSWQTGITWDADPLGNLEWGDCAYADPGHAIRLASALAGLPDPVTVDGIMDAYSAGTGFDPARPETDRGAFMLDVMKQWRNDGICGVRIESFVSVAPEHIGAAVALFGGVHLGFRLPSSIDEQDIWDDVGDGNIIGGHAVFQFSHSPGLGVINTWGQRVAFTPRFLARYCDEAYAVLMPDRPAPSGLDLDKLRSDLALIS